MTFLLNIMLLIAATAQSIETPKYQLIQKFEKFEIRDYGTVITAKTTVNSDFRTSTYTGFRRVANFIFGGNDEEKKNSDDSACYYANEKLTISYSSFRYALKVQP